MYTNTAWKFLIHIFALIGFILTAGYFAVKFGLTNEKGIIDEQRSEFIENSSSRIVTSPIKIEKTKASQWIKSEEWQVLKSAIIHDAGTIYRVSYDADVDPRLIVTILVPEQLRLFNSEREIFKKIFSPLKILGNQTQFSWGIMGLKQETAKEIEDHLKDSSSPYYLGEKYEDILDFKTANINQERFERLTNEKDHYYSYLYASLFICQIIQQWQQAGYDISKKPEIIGTLYNIGFKNSKPNKNPSSGGSTLEISGKTYSFGGLAGEFYYSDELQDQFPKN